MICMVNRNLGKSLAIALGVLGAGNVLTPVMSAGLFDATTSNLNDVLDKIINHNELNKCDTFKKKLDLLKKVIDLLENCNSKNYQKENIEKVHSMFIDSLFSATNATRPEICNATSPDEIYAAIGYLCRFSVIIGNNKEYEILVEASILLNVELAKERMTQQITPTELMKFVDKYGFRP